MKRELHSMKNDFGKYQYKILIVGNKNRFYHLNQFADELKKRGIEVKLIYDIDFLQKTFDVNFTKRINKNKNFIKILEEFCPNVVLLDRITEIGKKVIEQNIPLWILLRGTIWEEIIWAKKTSNNSIKQKLSFQKNEKLIEYCLKNSDLILPISHYLENIVREKYPKKKISYFSADGRTPEEWKNIKTNELEHPCVGLIQGLNIWGKTREILTLKKILGKLPNVTFYLAGDGEYSEKIIPELIKFNNFIWLKNLEYPKQIKKLFSEIDIFLLLSGLEGLGQTIIEALLMKKPVIATKVGGISELIIDNETGLLVKEGDDEKIIEGILKLLNDSEFAKKIAETGHNLIQKTHSWKNIVDEFETILKTEINDYDTIRQ